MYDHGVYDGVSLSRPNTSDAIVSSSSESVLIGSMLGVLRFELLTSLEMRQKCQYSLWPLSDILSGNAGERD